MRAFHSDPAVKSQLVDRLKAYAEAGAIINAENVWKDGKGSPSGCVLHDAGLASRPERTGMPKAVNTTNFNSSNAIALVVAAGGRGGVACDPA
jgi:hypothetical protein